MMVVNKEMFTFFSALLPEKKFYVAQFEGTEGLNSLFNFKLVLLCNDANIDTEALVGTNASFTIRRRDGEDAVFKGYISKIVQSGRIKGHSYYHVTLQPFFSKLKLMVNSAVFLDCDLKQTIDKIMTQNTFFRLNYEFRLAGKYPKKEFGMQYKENCFDYILRRLEEQGAYFYFDKDGERVIFADNPMSHDQSVGTVYYSPITGLENSVVEEVITSFTLTQAMLPARAVVRNYNWKDPNTMLIGKAEVSKDGIGEIYFSNEEADSRSEAERLAKIRAEQILASSRIFRGTGYVPFFRPGVVFTLMMHPTEKLNRDYVVTQIKHEGRQENLLSMVLGIPIASKQEHFFYRNSFECIESGIKYLPFRPSSKVEISGTLRGFIDGDAEGEALMDKYGRYKVLFAFDISGRSDGKASYWVRRAREQVGKDFGIDFPLVAGTEVLISFLDGNPDLPIITGALANGETGSISGGGNSYLSGIRTAGGPQLTFNNKNNGIQLSNVTGSGITMGSNSVGYMSERTHIGLKATASATSDCAGFFSENMSGFVYRRRAVCKNASQYLSVAAMALANTGQKIYDSFSSSAADPLQSKVDFGAMATKFIALLPFLQPQPYNMRVSASKKNTSFRMQCFPSPREFLVNILITVGAMGASAVMDGADYGVASSELPSDEGKTDLSHYTEMLKKSMQVIYDAGAIAEYKKYNGQINNSVSVGEYFEGAEKSPCDYYEQVKKALEDSKRTLKSNLEDAPSEENRIFWTEQLERLEKISPDLESAYNKNCKEKSEHDYNSKVKKNMRRKKVVGQLVTLLPELAVIAAMYLWRNRLKTKNIGGIMISAKDKNMNLHAKTYIGFHAERGIYFNTKNAKYDEDVGNYIDFVKDWGAPLAEENRLENIDKKIKDIFSEINTKFGQENYDSVTHFLEEGGHSNLRGNGVGSGPEPSEQNNRFITLHTDIYFMNCAYSFQTTKNAWKAFSPEFSIMNDAYTSFHMVGKNDKEGAIELTSDAGIYIYGDKVKNNNYYDRTRFTFNDTISFYMAKTVAVDEYHTEFSIHKGCVELVAYKYQGELFDRITEHAVVSLRSDWIWFTKKVENEDKGFFYLEPGYATLGGRRETVIGGLSLQKNTIRGSHSGFFKLGDWVKIINLDKIEDPKKEDGKKNKKEKIIVSVKEAEKPNNVNNTYNHMQSQGNKYDMFLNKK